MKNSHHFLQFPTSPEKIEAAIGNAPAQVIDPDCPYDPNDAEAVAAYWKDGVVLWPADPT